MAEFHIRILGADANHRLAPETRGFQHVFLVHATETAGALARRLKAGPRNALHFWRAVLHGVEALIETFSRFASSTRFAKVDVPGELPENQDIQTSNDLGLERRRCCQFFIGQRGPQISEQLQVLANPQNAALRSQFARKLVVLGAAHGPHENGIRFTRCLLGRLRIRRTLLINGDAAEQAVTPFDFLTTGAQYFQHTLGLGQDFGADTITGENQNFLVHV